MKYLHDVVLYVVLAMVLLLTVRLATRETPGVHVIERVVQGSGAEPVQSSTAEARTVTVTGTAEMLVPPDEISVNISFREYWGITAARHKVSIDSLEKRIVKAATKAGISSESIVIDSHGAWRHNWNYWHYWYGSSNMLMQRNLTIQLSEVSQLKKIVENLKSQSIRKEGIVGITLGGSSNSKIQEYRKRVKEKALQAAKAKATYLLKSVDEGRGRLVAVRESADPQARTTRHGYHGSPYYGWGALGGWGYSSQTQNSLGVSNVSVAVPYEPGASSASEGNDLSLKPIRLQYAIEATFEIM